MRIHLCGTQIRRHPRRPATARQVGRSHASTASVAAIDGMQRKDETLGSARHEHGRGDGNISGGTRETFDEMVDNAGKLCRDHGGTEDEIELVCELQRQWLEEERDVYLAKLRGWLERDCASMN